MPGDTYLGGLDAAIAVLQKARAVDVASIQVGKAGAFQPISSMKFLLDTAITRFKAQSFGTMKYLNVIDASDRNAYVYIVIQKNDDAVQPILCSLNQNNIIELDEAVSDFYVYFPAQAAKYITLQWSAFVKLTGKNLDVLSVISSGSNRALITPVAIDGLGELILPADNDRILAVLENVGAVDARLVALSTDGFANGITLAAGDKMIDQSKAALYGITNGGGTIINGMVLR